MPISVSVLDYFLKYEYICNGNKQIDMIIYSVLLPLLNFCTCIQMILCTVTSEDICIHLLKWDLSVAVYI